MDIGLPSHLSVGSEQPSLVVPNSLSMPRHLIMATQGEGVLSQAESPAFSSFSGSHLPMGENGGLYGADGSDSPASSIYSTMSGLASGLSNGFARLYKLVICSIFPE